MKRILAAAILLVVMGSPAAFAWGHHYKYPHPVNKHPTVKHPKAHHSHSKA
jgi:hypothetical protein